MTPTQKTAVQFPWHSVKVNTSAVQHLMIKFTVVATPVIPVIVNSTIILIDHHQIQQILNMPDYLQHN